MNTMRFLIRLGMLLALAAVLLSAALPALADGPGYTLGWWTVDGGGVTNAGQGGGYSLGGTGGQPDAAVWTDGHYTLSGGFWAGAVASYRIYLPLTFK